MVTSLATCIRANSVGDLIRRQARTRPSPETIRAPPPSASHTPSTMKNRVAPSTATEPWPAPRSRRAAAIRANGLSCSFHGRTSPPTCSVSRTEGSSKAGVTITTSPWAGITAAVVRSERCHCTPVK